MPKIDTFAFGVNLHDVNDTVCVRCVVARYRHIYSSYVSNWFMWQVTHISAV
jgi:hypothetical protein